MRIVAIIIKLYANFKLTLQLQLIYQTQILVIPHKVDGYFLQNNKASMHYFIKWQRNVSIRVYKIYIYRKY